MYSSRITLAFFVLLSAALFVLANPVPVPATWDLEARQIQGLTDKITDAANGVGTTTGGNDGQAAIGALSSLVSQIQSLLSQGTDNGGVTKNVGDIVSELQPTVDNVVAALQGITSQTLSANALPQINNLLQTVISNLSTLLNTSGGGSQDGLNNILNNILGAANPILGGGL